jgi:carboxymethylenebutenolidase
MGTFETIEAGGAPVRAYVAGGIGREAPGVLLFHAWWGLNEDAVAFADRLAATGFTVIAPDMFGGQVATTIDEAERLAGAADEEAINLIARAAADHLVDRLSPTARAAAVGFSFGAHWTMWSPAECDRLVASVLYYGTTGGPVLTRSSVPVLGHFAEDDPYESAEWVAEFEETLRSAGRDVTIQRYPGTGHWFAEPSRDAYVATAADLAFERTLEFLRRQLGTPAG